MTTAIPTSVDTWTSKADVDRQALVRAILVGVDLGVIDGGHPAVEEARQLAVAGFPCSHCDRRLPTEPGRRRHETLVHRGATPAAPVLTLETLARGEWKPAPEPVVAEDLPVQRAARRPMVRMRIGHKPQGGRLPYLPLEVLSRAEFQRKALDLWCDAGFYEDDVVFIDERVDGTYNLEAGNARYSVGTLRLRPGAPGFEEHRASTGAAAWVANFTHDSTAVVMRVHPRYEEIFEPESD